jgi:cob(I)alamin adenosyltransferase
LSGRRKKILFDQTQNERGRLESTYSDLGQLLRDNDFDVEAYTDFMILAKNIKTADVMVFGCPNSSKVRPAEIDVLQKYVKDGGGLLLLSLSGGDRGLMNNMSKISGEFGITFENTAVKDERSNAGLPTMPIITDIVSHPSTEDVSDLLIPSACSLKLTGKATALAVTSESAEPGKVPVVGIAEVGKGRVMCIGSYEVFRRGGGLKHKGNSRFAVNAFRWLGGELQMVKPSSVAKDKVQETTKDKEEASILTAEIEKTLKRLVNAVFDLQKDISKVEEEVSNVDKNVEMLRDQFQDFAEKTQQQFGIMIPAKQFKTADESKMATIQSDLKALKKEMKSVEDLHKHIEQRHSSGALPDDAYEEQVAKLEAQTKSLKKKIDEKEKELATLSEQQ